MARIRNTIELLVNILQQNGLTELKAETFRLAKFDDDNAVSRQTSLSLYQMSLPLALPLADGHWHWHCPGTGH